MATTYQLLANIVPVISFGVALVALVLGLMRFRSPTLAVRGDRRTAVVIALVIGLAAAGIIEIVVAAFAGFDTGPSPEHYLAALPAAAIAGALVFGASLTGYAAFTLGDPSRRPAIVGSLVGPAVLIGLAAGSAGLVGGLNQLRLASEADELVTRSGAALSISVRDITATYTSFRGEAAVVETISMTVVLRASADLQLDTATKTRLPRFRLDQASQRFLSDQDAPAGSPDTLPAGVDVAYTLTFETLADPSVGTGTGGLPKAGDWLLTVQLTDSKGTDYEAPQSFIVPPA